MQKNSELSWENLEDSDSDVNPQSETSSDGIKNKQNDKVTFCKSEGMYNLSCFQGMFLGGNCMGRHTLKEALEGLD